MKVLYDLECEACGEIVEEFADNNTDPAPCHCGGKRTKLFTNAHPAIWYCECPTASHGCAGNTSRPYGFVDDTGREHKIKYCKGTPVKNRFKTGGYSGEHDGTGREEGS